MLASLKSFMAAHANTTLFAGAGIGLVVGFVLGHVL